jgi:hypothetical protein
MFISLRRSDMNIRRILLATYRTGFLDGNILLTKLHTQKQHGILPLELRRTSVAVDYERSA